MANHNLCCYGKEQYKDKWEEEKQKSVILKQMIRDLDARMRCGTEMSQQDYEKLEKSAKMDAELGDPKSLMTDEQAILFVNSEFGFEASHVQILHEAELDVTEPNARYVSIEKIARKPLYVATDWNYVRFNVRACGTWCYEAINGDLRLLKL